MKTKTLRLILQPILCAVFLVCVAVAAIFSDNEISADALETEFSQSVNIAASYLRGEELTLTRAAIKVGGKNVLASDVTIKYPNGYYYKADMSANSAKYKLDQSGEYEVIYSAVSDGRKYSAKKTFTVTSELYSTQIDGSSVEYQASSAYYGNPSGLLVTLYKNDVFTYNKIINVNDLGRTTSFIEFFPITERAPSRDYAET